jgi:hypothetical protein
MYGLCLLANPLLMPWVGMHTYREKLSLLADTVGETLSLSSRRFAARCFLSFCTGSAARGR